MTVAGVVSRQEWRWASRWSAVILLLSCLPYLLATWFAPQGWQFAGILVNPLDGHSYLAKMRQGFEGQWLFHLTYTPEPHQGAFIFTFYLALGHLARVTGLPLIYVFHLARLLGGLGLLLIAFLFIARVTPVPGERRLAFLLLLTSSGLGWLGVAFNLFPIDLWIPEAFVPYSLYSNPHFVLAMALMLVLFMQATWPAGEPDQERPSGPAAGLLRLSTFLGPGLVSLLLALILPFALLTVWAAMALLLVWLYLTSRRIPWPHLWPAASAVLFAAPVIGYDYWVSTTNPVLAGWAAQNITAAPRLLDLVFGYGLVGMLALLGGWMVVRGRPQRGEWLLVIWVATTLVLLYLPFALQRRLINGLHIPLVILAAIGLRRWLAASRRNFQVWRLIPAVVVIVSALGTLFVWGVPILAARQHPDSSDTVALLFMRQEEEAAYEWLRENAGREKVVLASPRVGMFVPGQTGARAFYGHPFETIDAGMKRALVEAFYRGEVEAVSPPVDFVIYGPSEQALGRPARLAGLPVLFASGDVLIYEWR